MKKIITSISFAIISVMAFAQPTLIVNVPSTAPTTTQVRAPNGSTSHTTLRAHFILPASEFTGNIANGTSITSLGFNLQDGVAIGANGNFILHIENTSDALNNKSATWATAISTMTEVYNSNYTIPASATATTVDFTLSSAFTYTGGGIYIAYEYIGTVFDTDVATYYANNSIASAVKMDATTAGITTPPATLTQISSFRPQMRFGFANPNTNNLQIIDLVFDKGYPNPLLETSQTITGTVVNASQGALTNVTVSLDVTGANASSDVQIIPNLAAGASTTVSFTGLSLANLGLQTLTLSVPNDDVNTDNSITRQQTISCDTTAYIGAEAPYTNIGFNTGTGILATKMTTALGIQTRMRGVKAYISDGIGKTVKGVILNSAGVIIDSSAAVVLTAGQINTQVYFPFLNITYLPGNSDYYIGIKQLANAVGYFPVGTQQPENTASDKYFGFGPTGGAGTEITNLGNFIIKSVIQARFQLGQIPASGQLCSGNNATINTSTGFPDYQFFVDGMNVQGGTASSFTYMPSSNSYFYVIATYNGCIFTSPTDSFEVGSNVTGTLSDSFCENGTYNFNSTILSAPGTYFDTLTSSGGCDSLITLTLSQTLVDENVTVNSNTITSTQTGGTYLWIDCSTNNSIAGATSQSYTATVTGNYAVVVTNNGCSDTSVCTMLSISTAGLDDLGTLNNLRLYPNPTNNVVNVVMDGLKIESLSLMELNGKLIADYTNSNSVNLETLVPGVYLLKIKTTQGEITRRVIKQ